MSNNSITITSEPPVPAQKWFADAELFISKILDYLDIDNWEISILFCDDAFISSLNAKYRGIDSPTDVLSFEQGDEYIDDNDITWFNAGDIAISLDTLRANSEHFSVDINEELKRLLVHGILHLDGMDHDDNSPEQDMLQFQEHILAGFADDVVFKE
ncbi:rRNA maturation RNase YbeY [Brucepastera parasyntrophica]|uniref:rRNA maturation RNase YbeY n=1 Tax=Brucepastera parasyntrophica TaxID=2880008 RepID=UPI00210BE562|nr:rRNA maturation RNase YbeY [Brucepastera parasyntrophica]ULQ61230.1 rRNA maturation RNase YbeY [Brucepastera parasyntrophica]